MALRTRAGALLPAGEARAELTRTADDAGEPRVDLCALLLDARGCARGERDFVHPAAAVHASGAVRVGARDTASPDAGGSREGMAAHGALTAGPAAPAVNAPPLVGTLSVDLAAVEPDVAAVLVVARGESGPDDRLPGLRLRVVAGGAECARDDRAAADGESAAVLGAFRRDGGSWRFHVVGQGYRTGLAGLAAAHGLRRDALPGMPAVLPPPGSLDAPGESPRTSAHRERPARAGRPEPVTLTAGSPSVALAVQGGTSGTLTVTLDHTSTDDGGPGAPDGYGGLHIGALYELTDGRKGVVQALGGALGTYDAPPYIALRPLPGGAEPAGEAITLNLDQSMRFRRLLFFATVHQGVGSLAGLRATAVLHPEHGAPIGVPLDECRIDAQVCALAQMAYGQQGLTVRREARWIEQRRGVSPQRTVDYAYGWGLRWAPPRRG